MSRKNIYRLADIDDNIVRFSEAYLKKVITTSKKNYYRRLLKNKNKGISFEEYNDNILYSAEFSKGPSAIPCAIKIDGISIYIESEIVYRELNKLTDKQLTVLLKNVVLKIPMEEIAKQMGLCISKVYKHKSNAMNKLKSRLKIDDF